MPPIETNPLASSPKPIYDKDNTKISNITKGIT